MSVENSRAALSNLRHEAGTLQNDINSLTNRLNSLKNSLPSLLATAERRPSESAQVKVDLAEHDIDQLQRQITRKRAALQAIEADLKLAETELEQSEHRARISELRAIFDRVATLSTAIDETPTNPALWAEIRQEIMAGNSLYGRSPTSLFRVDPAQKCRSYFQNCIAARIEREAYGRNFSDTPKTLGDVLALSQSKYLLDQLSYSQPIEPEPVRGRLVESAFLDWIESRDKQPNPSR